MLFVLDASALINEPNFSFEEKHSYITTRLVVQELKTFETKYLTDNALHHDILKIKNPEEKTLKKIEKLVKKKGFRPLSPADVSVIALALELKNSGKNFQVLTDDYSVQNFLKLLKISFSSVIQGEIKKTIEFEKKDN